MKIGTHEVGPGHPTFIVAEGGSNHGGSLEAALALTDAAADAGANAMKWQLWLSADEMYDREQFPTEWASADRWRLPVEWLPALRDRAHERGMAFGLSSFGFASLDEADKWVDFHKVASIEGGWREFVHAVYDKKKPVIVSSGMRGPEDKLFIDLAVPTVWMQCTVAYPATLSEVDLRVLTRWPKDDARLPLIGYSDHTTHPTIAPCAAVALGACVIEKHLRLYGYPVGVTGMFRLNEAPDWPHSLPLSQFAEMVLAIRMTEQALGSSEKRIRKSEEPYLKYRRGPRGLRGS